MKQFNKLIPFVGAAILIVAIAVTDQNSQSHKNEWINFGLFIATVILALIAYIQLKALREQANASFLFTFNREFFGSETNQKIIQSVEEHRSILIDRGGTINEYQLDDYLGYFELMAHYVDNGMAEFSIIDETFGHYITVAFQNEEIQNYIVQLRKQYMDPRYYKPFEDLAIRMMRSDAAVRKSTV